MVGGSPVASLKGHSRPLREVERRGRVHPGLNPHNVTALLQDDPLHLRDIAAQLPVKTVDIQTDSGRKE